MKLEYESAKTQHKRRPERPRASHRFILSTKRSRHPRVVVYLNWHILQINLNRGGKGWRMWRVYRTWDTKKWVYESVGA